MEAQNISTSEVDGVSSKRTTRNSRPPPSPIVRGKGGRGKRGRKQGSPQSQNVETIAETEMEVDFEALGDETESQDMREGLVHEVDNSLALEEACLQIVPYVVQPEIIAGIEAADENKLYMDKGEDILHRTWILSCFQCPPVPSCRLIPFPKVRGLRDDVTGLKTAFGKEGYVQEKGAFIVSLWTSHREEKLVGEEIIAGWDPIWQEINMEFEAEIEAKPELHMLSKRMLYVWEGNHRTVAWQQAIKERFS